MARKLPANGLRFRVYNSVIQPARNFPGAKPGEIMRFNLLRPSLALCLSALMLASGLATGCNIRLISDYDAVLDQDVTTLQKDTEVFLNQLSNEVGQPAAAYSTSANAEFYVKADASLATMATRAASQPKSTIVVGQVQALRQTYSDMKQLHQLNGDKGLSAANIANTRSALESEFTSILTLELALKASSGVSSSALAPAKAK